MLRKIVILLMSLSLCWTTIGCSTASTSMETPSSVDNVSAPAAPTAIADGKYPVQQATYDDVSGEYTLMLLNTPAGTPPVLQTPQLQMAALAKQKLPMGTKPIFRSKTVSQ